MQSLTLGTWLSSSLALSRHWLLLTWTRVSFCAAETQGTTEVISQQEFINTCGFKQDADSLMGFFFLYTAARVAISVDIIRPTHHRIVLPELVAFKVMALEHHDRSVQLGHI